MRLCLLLFLAAVLKIMAKPLQVAPILVSSSLVRSEFGLDDTGAGQNTPGFLSPIPVQYIEPFNPFRLASLLDLGTSVRPEFNPDITGVRLDASSLPPTRSVQTADPDGFEIVVWPYEPYCPLEFAYCCTGDYSPETNKFPDGCSPCKFFFFFSRFSRLLHRRLTSMHRENLKGYKKGQKRKMS